MFMKVLPTSFEKLHIGIYIFFRSRFIRFNFLNIFHQYYNLVTFQYKICFDLHKISYFSKYFYQIIMKYIVSKKNKRNKIKTRK